MWEFERTDQIGDSTVPWPLYKSHSLTANCAVCSILPVRHIGYNLNVLGQANLNILGHLDNF